MYKKKYRPCKADRIAFAEKMREIEKFCDENGIHASVSNDSYYFTVGEQFYRVSNHSIEASNAAAFDPDLSVWKRELYHPGGRLPDVRYIHASKTRIIDIYNDLVAGYELDGNGRRKGVI